MPQQLTGQQYSLARNPQSDLELYFWVQAVWGVRIPWTRVCSDHVSPFEVFADAYFARHRRMLLLGSRGFSGKSFMMSILGLTEMVTLGAEVSILGGSGQQALRIHEAMTESWERPNAPKHLLTREPTKYQTVLDNGAKAITLMASQKSVRGPHPSRLRLDEIDEAEVEVINAAQGQPMRGKTPDGETIYTNTLMVSTHQYPDGPVSQMLRKAEEPNSDLQVYKYCYKESMNPVDGWLESEEVEQKRSEIPSRMWLSEYEIQEPSFGARAIDTDAVEKVFDPDLGFVPGEEGRYYEIEAPRYDRDYVTGVDWAKKQDMTVIATFDCTEEPWRLVAFERMNRRPWPVMVGRLNKRLDEYGGKCAHDATGLGSVVEDYIELPQHMNSRDLKPITMAGRQRNDLINNYINAVEKNLLVCPRIKYVFDQHKFATPDDVFSSSTAHHLPDSVAAFAIAWMFRKARKRIAAPLNTDLIREGSPWRNIGSL